ncbi:hypothetical protein HNR60_003287 [Rhodopseudomonas rhenobacensis]|uniref:Uncharacterized protein n=1 Tax=Rhodopseudomonas rhenobacensis TaxID=87461 RepID=A0A7W7Z5R1_9BRAD|nr:hypothetical protein [Rhodopseudomonas rhenobacensis]MBB5048520.1 hypothetical protein [Rhodopseudomonas rhenobacensis]
MTNPIIIPPPGEHNGLYLSMAAAAALSAPAGSSPRSLPLGGQQQLSHLAVERPAEIHHLIGPQSAIHCGTFFG